MIKQPTIPPMPKQPTFDARDTQYNLPIGKDLISRAQAIDALHMHLMYRMGTDSNKKRLDEWINSLPSTQPEPQHGRIFQEIVVEHPSISTYTEYEGKPYFSIKYTENGQEFIGYGTYKPEVLSGYLKDYFMPSAQPEKRTEERTETHACDLIDRQAAIDVADAVWSVTGDKNVAKVWDQIKDLPSAQPEPLSDAYMNAVWTWLIDYQIKAAELKGRYTPYEVLSWVANDWRKEHE